MKRIFIFVFLTLSLSQVVLGKEVNGRVIDAETKLPIPYANISMKGFAYGTISNEEGYFSLNIPANYTSNILAVSFIGYSTKEFKIESINSFVNVNLEPVATQISEVTVNPDSTIFTFLKKIYKKIPENYPTEPSMLTGFFREATTKPNGEFLYVAEALTRSYKTSYKNSEVGQVEVLKSRKNISPARDSVLGKFRYYGGIYTPHYSDVVHQRYSFIKPSNFRNYNYNYKGITSFNHEKVHVFEFSEKDTSQNKYTSGKFYVHTQSLAYVYFDISSTGRWKNEIGPISYSFSSRKVLYNKNEEGQWVLKSINRKSKANNKSTGYDYVLVSDYVVTDNTTKQVKSIAYNQQVQVEDIFTDFADEYNPDYWKGYNILKNDSLAQQQLQYAVHNNDSEAFIETEFKAKKKDRLLEMLKKLNYEFGFYFHDCSFNVDSINLAFKGSTINTKISAKAINYGYYLVVGYKFGTHFTINYLAFESLNKNVYYKQNQLGLEYLLCLKQGGRQFFALPSLTYNFGYSGYYLGDIDYTSEIIIDGKNFDDPVSFYSGSKQQSIVVGLKLKTQLRPLFDLVLGSSYFIPISTNDYLFVKENKGLIRTKAYQSFNGEVGYYEDGKQMDKSSFTLRNWNFNIGIRLNL